MPENSAISDAGLQATARARKLQRLSASSQDSTVGRGSRRALAPPGGGKMSRNPLETPDRSGKGRPSRATFARGWIEVEPPPPELPRPDRDGGRPL